jgi:hypothetical protein
MRHPEPIRRKPYLPIHPASHPDISGSLVIARGKAMKKPSYVNTRTVHIIPVAILRPCWQGYDFHLDKESYNLLKITIWREDVAKLAVQLKGHGIFEHVHQPAHVRVPAPILGCSSNRRHPLEPGNSSVHIGASSQTNPHASYGTFPQGWPGTAYPNVREAPATSIARIHNTSRPIHSGDPPEPSRPNYGASRQYRSSVEQSYHRIDRDQDNWSCALAFVVMIFLSVVEWYMLNHPEPM